MWKTDYYISIIPSYSIANSYSTIRLSHPQSSITFVSTFAYFDDNQAAIVPLLLSDGNWALVYQYLTPLDKDTCYILNRPIPSHYAFRSEEFLSSVYIVASKLPYCFYCVSADRVELIRVNKMKECLQIVADYFIECFQSALSYDLCKPYLLGIYDSGLNKKPTIKCLSF